MCKSHLNLFVTRTSLRVTDRVSALDGSYKFVYLTLQGRNVSVFYKTQSVPRCKHSTSVIKTSQLMLYREIIAFFNVHRSVHPNYIYIYIYIYKYPTRCNNAQCIFFISLQIYSFTLHISGAVCSQIHTKHIT
jgi:hypothetical protein